MSKMKIGNKFIGHGEPCFIIAEAGVNHNGDINLALKLVDEAKNAGADCVKFQTFYAKNIESKNSVKPDYFMGRDSALDKIEFMKSLELSPEEFAQLKEYCDKRDIIFMSTLYDLDALKVLVDIKTPAFKIGSSDTLNTPLLIEAAKTKIPILLSTGMTNMEEVELIMEFLKKYESEVALFQCTSQYPAPYSEINLKVIDSFKKKFNCPVGLSDHSKGIFIPVAAVAMGANIIEKHFTLSRDLPGVDQPASIEPSELREMVDMIRKTEQALGNGKKNIQPSEKEHLTSMRKSLVASRNLEEGTIIEAKDILVKRPGNGISPIDIDKIVGKNLKKSIKEDDMFDWSQFSDK